jgi:hypothetical protein
MGWLVFSGIFDRHPELAIITHHMGVMIPFCAGRIGGGLDQRGSRSDDPDDLAALGPRPAIDYFRMFYGDTALFGHAMESGLEFLRRRPHPLRHGPSCSTRRAARGSSATPSPRWSGCAPAPKTR